MFQKNTLAMKLAYQWVRCWRGEGGASDALDFAMDALDLGLDDCDRIVEALPRSRNGEHWTVPVRLVRARLALLLRTLIRADARDFGPLRATAEGIAYLRLPPDEMIKHGGFKHRMGAAINRRITPLWELARKATP